MLSAEERSQLVQVARLYYEDNLTQAEIAKKIGVSRPTVSKMLTKAKEEGIVYIEIRAVSEGNADLLKRLKQKFNLQGGLVVDDADHYWQEAAKYLHTELCYERNIGLGWGYAIGEIVKELLVTGSKQQEGSLYPLIGEAHIPNKGYHPDEMVKQWSEASGRNAYLLNSPAFPASAEEREEYESGKSYQEVYQYWEQMNAAVVGIKGYPGVPDEATATRFGDALKQQKAVGSFLSYYYNERGSLISGNNDYCIHIPLALMLRCSKVIGIVADNNYKAASGALKTGLLTHIVVTENIAHQLLK